MIKIEQLLPEIDYKSSEDRAIVRFNAEGTEALIYYYWETWHPCAYVKVNKWDDDFEGYNVPCHWWITFSEKITDDTKWNKWRFTNGYRIWWDYAHGWDYMKVLWSWKQWTTEEIMEDVIDVITWCKEQWYI